VSIPIKEIIDLRLTIISLHYKNETMKNIVVPRYTVLRMLRQEYIIGHSYVA